MYKKISKRFGQDVDDIATETAYGLASDNEGKAIFHTVDVMETEQEYLDNRHLPEWTSWTYVADDEGVADLREKFYAVEIYNSYGYLDEEDSQ